MLPVLFFKYVHAPFKYKYTLENTEGTIKHGFSTLRNSPKI